jgi:two-component system, OmpR family, phosphate regulon sensor histidine kinase PhoR
LPAWTHARADAAVALECVEDDIAMIDKDGTIRLWNRAAETITGLGAEQMLGRPIGEAVPGWERIVLDVPFGDSSTVVSPRTLPLDTLEGREVWLSLYGVAFAAGTVYAFRDVTDAHLLERMRNELIATVSHELRTPLAAICGAAVTLRRKTSPTTSPAASSFSR